MASINPTKDRDVYLEEILSALDVYKTEHPKSDPSAYRRNPASIRVRIIDPDFRGKDRVARDDLVWTFLDANLSPDSQAEMSMLVLLTPEERNTSPANLEYENPIPSML